MQDKPKQNLEFSPEEWALIVGFASWRSRTANRVGWYASALGPIVALGAYGALKNDVIAVGLAFVSLLAYVIWSSVGELRGLQLYRSIFSKIVAFKTPQEQSSAPEASA